MHKKLKMETQGNIVKMKHKCFKCGVDFELKDEIYKSSTSSKSIVNKRFNFRS